jgi:putative transposase
VITSCELTALSRSSWYYKHKTSEVNKAIKERLIGLSTERPRFGTPRMTVMIRKEFGDVNHKRVERLYKEASLNLPQKRRKRKWHGVRKIKPQALRPHQSWSMDFVHDRTENGRNLRVLNVVDDFTRELIACIPEHSFSGYRVARELDKIMELRDIKPRCITMDNGPEFISRAFMSWAYEKKIHINYIEPGKPTQNAFVESFNGKFRDECLNLNWFKDLKEAKRIIEIWKDDYNHHRPHSSLNKMSPMEYKSSLY